MLSNSTDFHFLQLKCPYLQEGCNLELLLRVVGAYLIKLSDYNDDGDYDDDT